MRSGSGIRIHGLSILIVASFAALMGCTGLFNGKLFKERAAETPVPVDSATDKSFFVDASGKPKTFMCAWAPEIGRGFFGEEMLSPHVNLAMHCNVEFEITESYVVGKMINPSFPDDRSRWKEWLKIPITKHFYYEREKDSHGRETNRYIENDSRSHWSARPRMKLNLAGMTVNDMGTDGYVSWQVTSVPQEEIEWDPAKGFLGFSIDATARNPMWASSQNPSYSVGSEYQGRFRVNFMEFKHDPTFKKVPYHQENSRFMNILHVMGRKVEGMQPELYAAHWDLRKTQDIYISGVPAHLEKGVINAVLKWNKTLQDAGVVPKGMPAFNPIVKNLKHPFDLRYPSMTWISDKRISAYAPLGIGMASADVRNGKILWGGVVMFGGMLEGYINAYTPLDGTGDASAAAEKKAMEQTVSPFQQITGKMPTTLKVMKGLETLNPGVREPLIRNLSVDHQNFLKNEITRLQKGGGANSLEAISRLKAELADFQSNNPQVNQIVADLLAQSDSERTKTISLFQNNSLQDFLGSGAASNKENQKNLAKMKPDEAKKMLLASIRNESRPLYAETGYSAANMVGSWMASPARKARTYPEMLESVVQHLALHEFGHFLGLGHQFKENIVPEEGTVPSRFIKYYASKANEAHEFSNATSVMGYRSGRVEMVVDADDLAPGPHDDLTLRYLYTGKYSAYDKKHDDFVFNDVPSSGKIPEYSQVKDRNGNIANLPTSYFPQCNDYDASLGADPYCNRWDRGSKAEDIVKGYFQHISDNLLANLYSLVGGGANKEYTEWRLWYSALDTFNRTRMFYDEMRRMLRSEPHLKPLWNQLRNNKAALMDFSTACQKPDPTSPQQVSSDILRQIFADKKIVDLCRANAVVLNEMRFFLNLPEADYAKVDHKARFISGGYLEGDASRNWGHIFGSWYQMSNLPLKISSLYALTASSPYILWGGYMLPNPYYDTEENKFLYRTLYPREYTKLIADTVQHNMRFAALGTDDTTTMGRSVLATGGLLPWQAWESNDAARLPREYNDLLNQQTEFQYSMVAILIQATPPDSGSDVKADHYKKFTAKIYDFFTGKETAARDVFILPKGQVLVWANGMFVYPITKLKFYQDTGAYVIAYKIGYDYEEGDDLIEDSVKTALMEKHNEILSTCVNGFEGNGLLTYFDTANKAFEGFKLPPGMANEIGKEKIGLFYKSIDDAYTNYEAAANPKIPAHFPIKNMRTICDEAIRGVGQITSGASLMNGYWLSITADYLEK